MGLADLSQLSGMLPKQGWVPNGPGAGFIAASQYNLAQAAADKQMQSADMDLDMQKLKMQQAHSDEDTFGNVQRQDKAATLGQDLLIQQSGMPSQQGISDAQTKVSQNNLQQQVAKQASRMQFIDELENMHPLEYASQKSSGDLDKRAKSVGMKVPDDYNTVARDLPKWRQTATSSFLQSQQMLHELAPVALKGQNELANTDLSGGYHLAATRLQNEGSSNVESMRLYGVLQTAQYGLMGHILASKMMFMSQMAANDPVLKAQLDTLNRGQDANIALTSPDKATRDAAVKRMDTQATAFYKGAIDRITATNKGPNGVLGMGMGQLGSGLFGPSAMGSEGTDTTPPSAPETKGPPKIANAKGDVETFDGVDYIWNGGPKKDKSSWTKKDK